jgi:hypothetical protein
MSPTILLLANLGQISTWKTWFRPVQKLFMEKKLAQIRQILKTKIPRSPGYMIILEDSQEY